MCYSNPTINKWSDGCLMYSGQIASTLFRNQQIFSLAHQKVALCNHDTRYGNNFRVLSRIPALSKGQPSNSGPLIDWCLTPTPELFQLYHGSLHKKVGAVET